MKQFIIIDCQNDFISGSLACHNADQAVSKIIDYLNDNPEATVFYSQDWHSPTNQSFEKNGGIWPVHCVKNTMGAALSKQFEAKLKHENHLPNEKNRFLKGQDDEVEEYSAFFAENSDQGRLHNLLDDEVLIAGIASEYCVLETIKELRKRDIKVSVLKDGLGYVDPQTHEKAIRTYKELGVQFV